MFHSWQRLQALPKTIIVLKEKERRRKDAAFLGMRKLTLENDLVRWGLKTWAGENMHQQTNPGPEIFQFFR